MIRQYAACLKKGFLIYYGIPAILALAAVLLSAAAWVFIS